MKKLFVILLNLISFCILGFAQSYEPFINETKQWKYVEEFNLAKNSSQPMYYIVTLGYFKGDTIINSLKFNKFYHERIIWDTTISVPYFFFEDTLNKQISVHDPFYHKTALLYDFTINEGDSFNRYVIHDTYWKLKVIKVDTFFTLNKALKRIKFNDSTTWIEGIGDITATMIPSYGDLICVKENESVLYLNKNYNNCDTVFLQGSSNIVKNEINNRKNIIVFPNPVDKTSILQVNINPKYSFKIEIFSEVGTLFKEDYFTDSYPIGEINLPKGLYIYRVIDNNILIGTDKIIIK